jgi:pseudouridine-5'-phosphate glycosidase/pseudouridine kinase
MPYKPTLDSNENFSRTAQYVAINDTKKDLVIAMSDMSLFEGSLPRHWPVYDHRRGARWTVVDANWPPKKIRNLMANSGSSKVAFEPVSVAKSARLFEIDDPNTDSVDVFPKNLVDLATPNQYELASMYASAKKHGFFESDRWWQIIDAFGIPSSGARDRFVSLTSSKMTDEGIPLQTVQLLPFIPNIITKLGADGVLLTKLLKPNDYRLTEPAAAPYILSRTSNGSTEVGGVYMRLFPGLGPVDDVVSVNGVGDTFLGVLVAGMTKGLEMERVVNIAQRGAVMTLRSSKAVSPELGNIAKVLAGMAE